MAQGNQTSTATNQGEEAGAAAMEAFIARWGTSAGAERANYQLFLAELCDLLGVPRPDPSVADEAANRYVFDKAVTFQNPDGKTSTGYIDLYRRGAFVCETKQSVAREAKDPLSMADPTAPKARRKSGTSVRGTAGWDDSMIAARGQAEGYVRALPDDNPPFLLVIDIGHSFELYADFSRLGKVYTDEILERLVALNHERAAEEKRGLVRWLRPEFQAKGDASGDVQREFGAADGDDDDSADADEAGIKKPKRGKRAPKQPTATDAASEPAKRARVKPPKATKQPWPKDLAEQTRAVRAALAAAGGIVTAGDVARGFKHAKQPRVEEILATLVALGHARRTDDGYAPA